MFEEHLDLPIVETQRIFKADNLTPENDYVTMTIEATNTKWGPDLDVGPYVSEENLYRQVIEFNSC